MGKHTRGGLMTPEEASRHGWTISIGGLLGRDSGSYDPKDPDKFKRQAEHYQAISDAEAAAEAAGAAGKPETEPAA